ENIRMVSPSPIGADGGFISEFAGLYYVSGNSGDGGQALDARFNQIHGLGVDSAGAVYLVDKGNNRIRGIAPDGTVVAIAGNGSTTAFEGDGYLGTATGVANLGYYLAVGPDDVVYFADGGYIRKCLRSNGQVWTVGGNGSLSSS